MLMLDNSLLPHIFLWKLSQNYGPLMSLRFGFKPTLVVSSAKMAEAVLKTHDLDFCSRRSLRGAMRLSYNALDLAFSPYTDYWKEMRKLCVVHLFSRVQKYRPIREDEVGRLPLTRLEKQLIDEHLDPNRLIPQEEDLLDVLLRIRMDREFPLFELTIDHIKVILMIVFIAGTDTAAATVIWVMIALMKNPECLKKTQAEVRDLVGKKGFVNEDDVQGLTYLKAVVKETFRLVYPGMRIGVSEVELTIVDIHYKFDWEMPIGMNKEDLDFDVVLGLAVLKKIILSLSLERFMINRCIVIVTYLLLNCSSSHIVLFQPYPKTLIKGCSNTMHV
ncbi:hypothetical protein GOBAR_AA25982 [Gossypium barbadense]|uniref:Cytochrome P450 n=2 Tax=Gossypium TaxID=3633 RepID=A0A2P5WUA5_GOSBA|nr:hypothetical protein GOBAR_AA25982 [Gossypium barbadense]